MKKPSNSRSARKKRNAVKQPSIKEVVNKAAKETNKAKLNASQNFVGQKIRKLRHKRKVKKDTKARKKAEYLATLPKSRVKRILYRLHPKRVLKFWFSKQGLLMGVKLAGVSFGLMVIFILGLFAYFRRDLPNPREISSRLLNQSTKFYDRTGKHLLFEVYGDENRTVVEFDEISDPMKWATVAVEDKDFYRHGGVSFTGIARAAWSNVASGDSTGQGGSTITQQFIKNSLLTTEQTYTRKVKEIILAIELERLYTKDEILSFYLNEIPYGPQEYGVEAAAQSYFGKSAKQLDISEAAMLAALPQAPTFYSPYGENKEDLIGRQQVIIDLMKDQGYITQEEADKAKEVKILKRITPLGERSLYANIFAPHFVLEVQRQLEENPDIGPSLVQNGGLKVITTLDYDLQKIAERAVKQNMGAVLNPRSGGHGDNTAIVSTDVETGQVTAMVGSRDFNYPGYGSYNAALADRQPGSSFKPFDYSQLFYNDRWGPDSFIYDTNTTFGDYAPKNFDFGYRGQMLVRQAIGESRNIPAVKAASIAGIDEVAKLSIAMGNKSLADDPSFDLSYSLGAGEVKLAEHTHAYGTFARGGKYLPQTYIISVENAEGDKLIEWKKEPGEQVLDEQIAWLMTNILTDDAARSGTFGLGNPDLVVPGLKHAVKTGTTDRSVDGLVMGYSAYMSVGVWAGNHDNTPMDSITSQQTGPIFTQFFREASLKKKYDFQKEIQAKPAGIKAVKMDRSTGYAAGENSRSTYTGLFPSWYKVEKSDTTTKYTIDTVSNKRATECTPERAKEVKVGGGRWPEVLSTDYRFPVWSRSAGYGASGGAPTEKDDVHDCDDELPEISLDVNKVSDTTYELQVQVSRGTFRLKTLNFIVDDQTVQSVNVSGSGGSYNYTHVFTSNGKHTIKAEIIDAGLYDNSNSDTVKVSSAGSSSLSFTAPGDGDTVPTNQTFVWTAVAGTTSYEFCYKLTSVDNYSGSCLNNGTVLNYSPGLTSGQEYDVRVRAKNGSANIGEAEITVTVGP